MAHDLKCWRCGTGLAAITLPLRRREECPACGAELHVCRMCLFFDRHRSRQCRQADAEEVRNKEQANFCDWFKPNPRAFDPAAAAAEERARNQFEDLFKK